MASIQLRNVPDDLYNEIYRRARQENRTVPQQTINMLKTSALEMKLHHGRRKKIVDELQGKEWPPVTIDTVEAIRKDRDER